MAIIFTIDELISKAKESKIENLVLVLPSKYKGCEVIIEKDLPQDSVFITVKGNYEDSKRQHLEFEKSKYN